MRVDTLPIGKYEENIYVLHEDRHVLIIDPGMYAKRIAEKIEKDETVDAIILTHGHDDHTGAVDDLVDLYHCDVYIHPADKLLATMHGSAFNGGSETPIYSPVKDLVEGETDIGTFHLEIYSTPGHTAGSIMIRYKNILFTGDTLFAGTVGRTDLFSGDETMMMHSLGKIRSMRADLTVYPGHGPSTTIAQERLVNPYLHMINAAYD